MSKKIDMDLLAIGRHIHSHRESAFFSFNHHPFTSVKLGQRLLGNSQPYPVRPSFLPYDVGPVLHQFMYLD